MKRLQAVLVVGVVAMSAFGQSEGKTLLDIAMKRLSVARTRVGEGRSTDLRACVPYFDRAAAASPEGSLEGGRAHLEAGRLLKRLEAYAEAESRLKMAASRGPSSVAVDALHELASMYRRLRRVDDASGALDTVLAVHPGETRACAEALVRLASLHRGERRSTAARAALTRCLDHYVEHRTVVLEALEALVALEVSEGDTDVARRAFSVNAARIRERFGRGRERASVETALARIAVRLGTVPSPQPKSPPGV